VGAGIYPHGSIQFFLKTYFRTRHPVLGCNFQLIFEAADGETVALIVVEAVDI
jgi:hypothetical protein